jgi:APA family basic amino acid/polyamine antiporter
MAYLRRELGVLDAMMMGLGSIIGTGIFVSVGVAAGAAGPAVVLAVALGAVVASANGLSSAQLAASHPVSGGTYEYGYRYLSPAFGFTAGWMFLIAKSASAATAALGTAGYLLAVLGAAPGGFLVPVALAAVILVTAVILFGIRLSSGVNAAIVSATLVSLTVFTAVGLPRVIADGFEHFKPFFPAAESVSPVRDAAVSVLRAAALMFVAYTGYGRIATLGEEVKSPRTTIPKAVTLTLATVMALYTAVTVTAVGIAGAPALAGAAEGGAAPLVAVSRLVPVPAVSLIVSAGAVSAMLGVLLNLILGLSRVLLAMGRRADMPASFGKLNHAGTTPTAAVIGVSVLIAALAATGNVGTTWSFSAFSVLVYYAVTNLAAFLMPKEERLYPRWIAAAGFAACASLAFFVERGVWLTGLGLIAAGLVWFAAASTLRKRRQRNAGR